MTDSGLAPASPHPILDLDACALTGALQRGDLTCFEVTSLYLKRIAEQNPVLHAVISVNPQALAQAQALDELPAQQRGALYGVPMLIKDNIDVAGLPTTGGSALLKDHVPAEDAPLVARLRAAGAVILGKANMTEWANFMTLGMKNGFSSLGGQTVNPWGAGHDTGGSSSGSGVGVAARLCAAAIGTETSGSIVSPAHQNGVVGLKPTLGLVPRTGIIPISHSQDTAGPLTRSVRDAALIMSVIAGPDKGDQTTRQRPVPDFQLPPDRLLGASVGIVEDEPNVSDVERQALDTVREKLKEAGASVREVNFPGRAELAALGWSLEVLLYEFKGDLNAYLRGVTHGPRNLAEVIQGNDEWADECLLYGQTLLHAAQGTRGDAGEQAYARARERDLRVSQGEGFDPLFASGLDLLVFPGIHGYWLAAKAAYPSLALPVPQPQDRPGGVLLVAPAYADAQLLAYAAHLNRLLGGVRFPPS